ncbi:MAG: hypothetical protein Q7T25_00490 [Sideroxyarcus sp.]|nr:hypothetical protein [Sideroxyarcus sp.]
MFNYLCECSPIETRRQIDYLSSTPVFKIAELLNSGQCVLKKGAISSLHHLGNLKTEFGPIGSLLPAAKSGERKFLVSEIVPMLRANRTIPDGGLLQSIETIMKTEAKNEVDFNITLLSLNGEIIIKDGNKRTIAYYENRKNFNRTTSNYEVYLVESASNST